jgi:hypothetical protein
MLCLRASVIDAALCQVIHSDGGEGKSAVCIVLEITANISTNDSSDVSTSFREAKGRFVNSRCEILVALPSSVGGLSLTRSPM